MSKILRPQQRIGEIAKEQQSDCRCDPQVNHESLPKDSLLYDYKPSTGKIAVIETSRVVRILSG
jgi:hypothetical protein